MSCAPYKTILVHADQSPHAPERIRVAAELARAFDAHLTGAAMTGIPRLLYQDVGLTLAGTVLDTEFEGLYAAAETALDQFEQGTAQVGVASVERRLLADDPAGGLVLQARYADLVVLSQADRTDPAARSTADLPEYVLLHGGRPVLIVPVAPPVRLPWQHLLVGWDGGREATRAIDGALPLLQRAARVTLAVFDPGWRHGEEPGADLATYLARHGVACTVECRSGGSDTGRALLDLASALQADCLVLGGYGHARLRELLLGGVTDTVLRQTRLPLLMAH